MYTFCRFSDMISRAYSLPLPVQLTDLPLCENYPTSGNHIHTSSTLRPGFVNRPFSLECCFRNTFVIRRYGRPISRSHGAIIVQSSQGDGRHENSEPLDRGFKGLLDQGRRQEETPFLGKSTRASKQGDAGEIYMQSQWQQYDQAVQERDLAGALDLLTALNRFESGERARPDSFVQSLLAENLEAELSERLPANEASSSDHVVSGVQASASEVLPLDQQSANSSLLYSSAEFRSGPGEGVQSNGSFADAMSAGRGSELPVVEVLADEAAVSLPLEKQIRYLKILDAGLAAEDMRLVSRAYDWLQTQGLLRSFGRVKPCESDGPRLVTPTTLKELAGLEAAKLSPKKWGSSNSLAPLLVFAGISALVNNGVDLRPVLVVALSAVVLDAMFLGGTGFGQLMSQWKPYRRRVLVHEAGHVVAAYLLGCPVRGVVLDAVEAVKMGIQGQAGTQFWDLTLEEELKQGRLTGASIDRYSIVLFAGMAAEALVYGEAEGGESDENMFKAVVQQLQPVWSPGKISNQARWAVLQAYLLLKAHQTAHEAVVEALERGAPMGELARAIEDSMADEV